MWAEVDNETDKNLKSMYRYNGSSWDKLYNINNPGGGDCVGKWLDEAHTSVAFNDHRFNTSNTRYDIMSGFRNTIYNQQAETSQYPISGYNDVGGDQNKVYNSSTVFCRGHGNTVGRTTADGGYKSCSGVSVQGNGNKVIQATYSEVCGDGNTVTSGSQFSLSGYDNTVGYLYASTVSGEHNSLGYINWSNIGGTSVTAGSIGSSLIHGDRLIFKDGVSQSIIGGLVNTFNGRVGESIVCGSDSTFSGLTRVAACGKGHTGSAMDCLIGGEYAALDTSHYLILGGGNSGNNQNIFTVSISGSVQAAGGYGSIGADYAEYFEWADGNPDNEDRRGMLVALDGDKIVPATGNGFFGIVSSAPSIVGNSAELCWNGKYRKDVFGRILRNEDGIPLISENYDSKTEYIPRSERPEWAAVGLVGRLVVIDDGTCEVGKYVTAKNGIGTLSDHKTGARMMKRIDENHIQVLLK